MKIVHISTEPSIRGGERQLLRIHEGVLAAGEESVIICPTKSPLLQLTLSVNPYRKSIVAPLQIVMNILRENPDVIHCHDSRSLTYLALIKPLISQPILFSRKTVFPLKQTRSARKKYSSLTELIAISKAAASSVREIYPEIPVTVIHDGVTITNELSRTDSRKELGISSKDTLFASVGYFTGEKNIDLLIKCADLFQSDYPHCKLLLIGNVADNVSRSIIENHPAIIFPGVVENAEWYYRGFDHYLSASTQEGLGSALLDAVIRDIPSIALNSGGSQEIFTLTTADHCVTADQFLERLAVHALGNFDSNEVADRGKISREQFSIEQLVEQHLALYERIVTNQ